MERSVVESPSGQTVFPFPKVKQRIVEELAIRMAVEFIGEDDGIRIPPSWMKEVEMLSREIFDAIKRQAEKEGVRME